MFFCFVYVQDASCKKVLVKKIRPRLQYRAYMLTYFIFYSLSRLDLVDRLNLRNKRGLTTTFTKSSLGCIFEIYPLTIHIEHPVYYVVKLKVMFYWESSTFILFCRLFCSLKASHVTDASARSNFFFGLFFGL